MLVDITALFPVANSGVGGLCHQCRQSLVRGGVLVIVHPEQVQGRFVGRGCLSGLGDLGIVDAAHDSRRNDGAARMPE